MTGMLKKALVSVVATLMLATTVKADKGMWLLNELTQENLQQMRELGFTLSSEELYSLSKPSVAGSVVIFGHGCTGVTVSNKGLIMTNHHCGYGAIQSQSTVDHDYLRDGFVSHSFEQELPIEGLQIRYLSDIKDVTPKILSALKKAKTKNEFDRISKIEEIVAELIRKENARLKQEHKEVIIRPYYAGNKYYMITYDVFNDVRMVFAPPSSIGKFGGDTDNWMWTRHTGDFSVFRVYASPDNKPAYYSEDNVPYQPKHFASVSMAGYKEGDFAMTIGFPGSTQRYIPSWGIENRMNNSNAPLIEARGTKQAIWRKAMDGDQATRIKYSDKYASSANYWKNSIGMNRGLTRLKVVDRKREEEAAFANWVASSKGGQAYAGVLEGLEKAYKESGDATRRLTYIRETLIRGTEVISIAESLSPLNLVDLSQEERKEYIDAVYKDYQPSLDREVLSAMVDLVRQRIPRSDLAPLLDVIDQKFGGDSKAYADYLFSNSFLLDKVKLEAALADYDQKSYQSKYVADPATAFVAMVAPGIDGLQSDLQSLTLDINRLNRLYFAGRQEMDPKRPMPSDANFTMRMSYGSVLGYEPGDAISYNYFTTPKGILEKYVPGSTEFDLKPEFIDLLEKEQWGRWVDQKSGIMHVNFLSNNDITGGNSGSPVFDKNGRVIGLAFDGNWEAMSGDIEFEPMLQRTISVDIRYCLFVIEQWGKCSRLVEELELHN